jgi:hypothetical protein
MHETTFQEVHEQNRGGNFTKLDGAKIVTNARVPIFLIVFLLIGNIPGSVITPFNLLSFI